MFDDSQSPFISFYLSGKEFTDSAIEDFIRIQNELLTRETQFVILYKAENLKYMTSEHRIKLGQWIKANDNAIKEKVLAAGYLVHGFFGKMILNGIFLVQKPAHPYLISSEESEIMTFFEKHLEEAQVAVQ